jgi:hypothetical protein
VKKAEHKWKRSIHWKISAPDSRIERIYTECCERCGLERLEAYWVLGEPGHWHDISCAENIPTCNEWKMRKALK